MTLPPWLLAALCFNLIVTGAPVLKGGPPERFCALFLFAGALVALMISDSRWVDLHSAILWLDTAYFVALTLFALKVDRWWPLWTAALQGVCVTIHLAFRAQDQVMSLTCITALNLVSYGVTASVGVGVLLYLRRPRLSATGAPVELQRKQRP